MNSFPFSAAGKGMTKFLDYQISQFKGKEFGRTARRGVTPIVGPQSQFGKFGYFVIWSHSPAEVRA
jgi:hypothetical protein